MTINEAYEKYKHLDRMLSNRLCGDSFQGEILLVLWTAVKGAVNEQTKAKEAEKA